MSLHPIPMSEVSVFGIPLIHIMHVYCLCNLTHQFYVLCVCMCVCVCVCVHSPQASFCATSYTEMLQVDFRLGNLYPNTNCILTTHTGDGCVPSHLPSQLPDRLNSKRRTFKINIFLFNINLNRSVFYDVWKNRWVLKKISKDTFDGLADYVKNIKQKLQHMYVCCYICVPHLRKNTTHRDRNLSGK
jgi:hypothetical protein